VEVIEPLVPEAGRDALAAPEPWQVFEPARARLADSDVVMAPVARVALLRAAGVTDTLVVAEVLDMLPSEVTGLEAEPEYGHVYKRVVAAAGLVTWRAHVEATVATGVLPSGARLEGKSQAGLLSDLFEREEPKRGGDGEKGHVLVLTGDAMDRVLGGLREGGRPAIDVTPRTVAPAMDEELERRLAEAGPRGMD